MQSLAKFDVLMEKRSVFLVNLSLIILVILCLFFGVPLRYFFYFNLVFTFVLSYFFFKTSKLLSKVLILTNMFILFYFLFPSFSQFLYNVFGEKSYFLILFYNVFLALLFLFFSGNFKSFLGNLKEFKFGFLAIVGVIGVGVGLLFFLVREPIPYGLFLIGKSFGWQLFFVFFSAFVIALSEQLIFLAFLYNMYAKLTSKHDAFYQTAVIFVLFHLLRFESLVKFFHGNFGNWYFVLITIYYVLLFLFMVFALYLYSFRGKKYCGNFVYPLTLHFVADSVLFLLFFLKV